MVRKNLEKKKKTVEKLIEESKNYKTVLILALEKTPGRLLRQVRKIVKEHGGKVYAGKKAVLGRVIKNFGLDLDIDKPYAIIFSNDSPYQLAQQILAIRQKRAAKAGEIAEKDIEVSAGETSLPAGPALSELKAAGLNARIQSGKIAIASDQVVVKAGEVIKDVVAKALQKLDIFPFEVKADVLYGYDGLLYNKDVLYITKDDILTGLSDANRFAFNMAYNTDYYIEDTVKILLGESALDAYKVGVKAGFYTEEIIKQLLANAVAQGQAVEKKVEE